MKKIVIIISLLLCLCGVSAEENYKESRIYKLAESYVGAVGDCFATARKFLREYYNDPNYKLNVVYWDIVSYEDAKPGDVVFYSRSSLGTTHWAVYLGGGEALNGNVRDGNGYFSAKILSVFLEGATEPVFYHKPNSNEFKFDFSLLRLS